MDVAMHNMERRREEYSVERYLREKNNLELLLDHPVQRYSCQWSTNAMSDLIRRILQGKNIANVVIARQKSINGTHRNWLVDGVQRVTTIERYINNEFKISRTVREPQIVYEYIEYETNDAGEILKDNNGNKIIKKDIDGGALKHTAVFDIRNKTFNQLPIELQQSILNYHGMPAEVMLDCSDEDIVSEIRDCNSGKPMNIQQKGITFLGKEIAATVKTLAKHSFIINKCDFSKRRVISGDTERAINDSLMLINFPDAWSQYAKNCVYLGENLTVEMSDELSYLMDMLDEIIPEDDDIKKELNNKELFIILGNFAYFISKEKYDSALYYTFLEKWWSTLRYDKFDDDEDSESYVEISATSTKSKRIVLERLDVINTALDSFLDDFADDCKANDKETVIINDDNAEEIDDIDDKLTEKVVLPLEIGDTDDLNEIAESIFFTILCRVSKENKELLLNKVLLVSSDFHFADLDCGTIEQFNVWFGAKTEEEKNGIIEDCSYHLLCAGDYLCEISEQSKLMNTDDLLCLLFVIKQATINDWDEGCVIDWLIQFSKFAYDDNSLFATIRDDQPSYIMGKISYMQENLIKFINERTISNEVI